MNEMIHPGNEMSQTQNSMKTVIQTVLNHALYTRPKKEVYFVPYTEMEGVEFSAPLSWQHVDLDRLYPQAAEGDIAYVDFEIRTWMDYEIYLNVSGNVRVYFEGVPIFTAFETQTNPKDISCTEGMYHLPVSVRTEGKNFVRIVCVKHNGVFGFRFLLSVRRYPTMWANDYLYAARAVSPLAERKGEDGVGISACIHTGKVGLAALETSFASEGEYLFPPCLSGEESFDFQYLCGKGDTCYVYTEVLADHKLWYQGDVDRVWVNGIPVSVEGQSVSVRMGDHVLFRCVRRKGSWKLSLHTGQIGLPFLQSARGKGDKAIFAGPFYGLGVHAPEYEWDFSKVFCNEYGEKLYWRFCDGSRMRIYLDSVFYGQWFYALMVGFYGIRRAAQLLGDEERQRLFCDNMSFLAKYFDYIQYDLESGRMPAFMPRTGEMDVLDNIGTMGMNLIDSYFDSNDVNILPLTEIIAARAERDIPRLPDGTYYRVDTMWADDLYMSCPFLVRMGRLTGDVSWYEKAVRQVKGFADRLYIEEEGLFSHIFFPQSNQANRVPWGRGNGWVMWTLSEILLLAEGKTDVSYPLGLFRNMAWAIRNRQDESGLWRQVLNRTEDGSYLETSCTAMFLLAFTRGVANGWLDGSYLPCMKKAWKGLLSHSIDKEGNIYGVCMGSGCAMEAEYYFSIPTIVNDDHGTGIVLAAAAEFRQLLISLEEQME